MQKFFPTLIMFLILAVWAFPARADLDQLCLKQCVSDKGNASMCMAQCSYGTAKTQETAPTSNKPQSQHSVFSAPVPSDNKIVITHKQKTAAPEKDYGCFSECLHAGSTYQLCEQRCAKAPCPTGSSGCTTVTGTINGAPASR